MNTRDENAAGALLRSWRARRRLSQLELSAQTGISARHLSFVETGRSRPSRALILALSSHLDIPLRDRNRILHAGGFSPEYRDRVIDEPALAAVRSALHVILDSHGSTPALVVDRHWNVVDGNAAMALLLDGVAPFLLEQPINSLRVALHPQGVAQNIVNLPQLRHSVIERVRRQTEATGDATLDALLDELSAYPGGMSTELSPLDDVAIPLILDIRGRRLSFLTTIATFGAPTDVTVSELVIESFFAADAATAEALAELGNSEPEPLAEALLRLTRG